MIIRVIAAAVIGTIVYDLYDRWAAHDRELDTALAAHKTNLRAYTKLHDEHHALAGQVREMEVAHGWHDHEPKADVPDEK